MRYFLPAALPVVVSPAPRSAVAAAAAAAALGVPGASITLRLELAALSIGGTLEEEGNDFPLPSKFSSTVEGLHGTDPSGGL